VLYCPGPSSYRLVFRGNFLMEQRCVSRPSPIHPELQEETHSLHAVFVSFTTRATKPNSHIIIMVTNLVYKKVSDLTSQKVSCLSRLRQDPEVGGIGGCGAVAALDAFVVWPPVETDWAQLRRQREDPTGGWFLRCSERMENCPSSCPRTGWTTQWRPPPPLHCRCYNRHGPPSWPVVRCGGAAC